MSLLSAFKTPLWEQRDPERRAAAVRDESAPELLAKLPEIALKDPDAGVRKAALSRLSEPAVLLARHRDDEDAGARAAAATRLGRVLADPAEGLALDARIALLTAALPLELLERVAESAPETEVRRAAMAHVTRAGFIARRCAEDPDPGLRAELLQRIDGEDALERLAESLRKRDKQLARSARERVTELRLARGDAAALESWALALCDTLTQWAQQLPPDVELLFADAQQQWSARKPQFDDAMQRRVTAYFERVSASQAMLIDQAAATRAAEQERVERKQREAAAAAEAAAAGPPLPTPDAPDTSELDAAMKQAEKAVNAQHLGEARPAFQRARELLHIARRDDSARRERFARIEQRFGELEQWQRWSGNRVRARLCEELEALIAAGHHPDAVANGVRDLQQEWAKVEAAEPGDADRSSGLARRFRALCGRAMAPTRPYFEQRHALRAQRREAVEALIAEAAPEPVAALTAPALIGLRRKHVDALRGLDEVEPKVRSKLAKRLREGLTRLDAALEAQREQAALERRKLIAHLRRELTHADPATAIELARQAQQQWKTMPRVAREQSAALEQELRELIDPLFAKEREQREQSQQQTSHIETESRRILAELKQLAGADADTLAHAEGRIAALNASWRELHASAPVEPAARDRRPARGAERGRDPRDARGGRDARRDGGRDRDPRRDARGGARDSERAFDQAVEQVRRAQANVEASRLGARLRALAAAADLFVRVEHDQLGSEAAEAQWSGLDLDDADRKRIAARWEQACSRRGDVTQDAAADAAANSWLVEAELDVGVDSPASAQTLRRQLQMQRLATRMQGAVPTAVDPRERLLQWALLGPLNADDHDQRQQRVAKVLAVWAGS